MAAANEAFVPDHVDAVHQDGDVVPQDGDAVHQGGDVVHQDGEVQQDRDVEAAVPANRSIARIVSDHPKTIVMESTSRGSYSYCCSWTGMCELLCNRQTTFIEALRPLRAHLNQVNQTLMCYKTELEREFRLTTKDVIEELSKVIKEMNTMTADETLNIPPDEQELLRSVTMDLAVLLRLTIEVDEYVVNLHTNSPTNAAETKRRISAHLDETALNERIAKNCDNLQQLMKWIDTKTERRWWLRDVVAFAQVFTKLALFVSAAVSVIYHQEQTAPIITLSITILQGVIEVIDQFFVKKIQPKEIKMSVISNMSSK